MTADTVPLAPDDTLSTVAAEKCDGSAVSFARVTHVFPLDVGVPQDPVPPPLELSDAPNQAMSSAVAAVTPVNAHVAGEAWPLFSALAWTVCEIVRPENEMIVTPIR